MKSKPASSQGGTAKIEGRSPTAQSTSSKDAMSYAGKCPKNK